MSVTKCYSDGPRYLLPCIKKEGQEERDKCPQLFKNALEGSGECTAVYRSEACKELVDRYNATSISKIVSNL